MPFIKFIFVIVSPLEHPQNPVKTTTVSTTTTGRSRPHEKVIVWYSNSVMLMKIYLIQYSHVILWIFNIYINKIDFSKLGFCLLAVRDLMNYDVSGLIIDGYKSVF